MNTYTLSHYVLLSLLIAPVAAQGMEPWQTPQEIAQTMILDAAKQGNLALMQEILAQHPELSHVWVSSPRAGNPLHAATVFAHLPIVQYLIEQRGADIYALDNAGNHILYLAASINYLPIVQYLVERHNFDIYRPTATGKTALDIALEQNNIQVLEYLLQALAPATAPAGSSVAIPVTAIPIRQPRPVVLKPAPALQAANKDCVAPESVCPICQEKAHDVAQNPAQVCMTVCCNNFICAKDFEALQSRTVYAVCPFCRKTCTIKPATLATTSNQSAVRAQPALPKINADESCMICKETAKDMPESERHITQCCKKLICKSEAQEWIDRAKRLYAQMMDPEQRRRIAAQDNFAGWPRDLSEHAKCPNCQNPKLETVQAIMG